MIVHRRERCAEGIGPVMNDAFDRGSFAMASACAVNALISFMFTTRYSKSADPDVADV